MSLKTLSMTALCAAILAVPAMAQDAGNVELAGFATYTRFDQSLVLDKKIGGGGLIGLFFANNFALEADASYTKTQELNGSDVKYFPIRARLTYNIPLGGYSAFLLGVGGVRAKFSTDDPNLPFLDATNYGATALAGFRFGLSDHVGIRLDGTMDYIPSPENEASGSPGVSRNINYGARAGLSFLVGSRGPKDSDKDGVANEFDQCPDTPMGDRVDGAGCSLPKDSDGDGILDKNDKCANTPAGVRVDTSGCEVKDADNDGVMDNVDKCPNTPAGVQVDGTGCPKDADNDGVMDGVDKCPNTPAGAKVDTTGCPVDADGDGVTDAADRCPNTPAGTKVDGSGCPITDSDKDGIPDSNDKCPGTPAGLLVGPNGCVILFEEGKKSVTLEGVTFELNKASLTLNAQKVLDLVAQSLQASKGFNVEVAGHTDSTGGRTLNTRLAQARAQSVKDYLVKKGVDASRLTAKGYGPDRPVATNKTPEGRAQNRRVELIKLD